MSGPGIVPDSPYSEPPVSAPHQSILTEKPDCNPKSGTFPAENRILTSSEISTCGIYKGLSSRSLVSNSAIPWTVAHQGLLAIEFSREENWSAWPFPSGRDHLNPGSEPTPPALAGRFLPLSHQGRVGDPNWLKLSDTYAVTPSNSAGK